MLKNTIKKINQKVRAFFAIVRRKKRWTRTVRDNKSFLVEGKYKSNHTHNAWYLVGDDSYGKEDDYLLLEQIYISSQQNLDGGLFRRIINKVLHFLLFRESKIYIKSDTKEFSGTMIILSRRTGTGKVISLKNKEIVSFYDSTYEMEVEISNRKKFEQYGFNTIPILVISKEKKYFIEKYIEKCSLSLENAFNYICKETLRFQQSTWCKKSFFKETNSILRSFDETTNDVELHSKLLTFLKPENYIRCLCHSDLYRNNILYDGENYYYIDFELAEEHIFFFDIFYFMWFEYYRFNNKSFLQSYFKGDYDDYFTELFMCNNVKYDSMCREVYYFISLYEYFCTANNLMIPSKLLDFI